LKRLFHTVTSTVGIAAALALLSTPLGTAASTASTVKAYNVVLAGTATTDGFTLAATREAVLALVASAGGTVQNDLSDQIGVLTVYSSNELFDEVLRASTLVQDAGEDFVWKGVPSSADLVQGSLQDIPPGIPVECEEAPGDPVLPLPLLDEDCKITDPDVGDPLRNLQWDMQICVLESTEYPNCEAGAHTSPGGEAGRPEVDVGILDTGIDGTHLDFHDLDGDSNVDCLRGRNSITSVPTGPGVGTTNPCVDNGFHGTHVAGTVAAQA